MKITCEKSILVNAMRIILKAIPKRTTNPIMECVLIEADKEIISLTSNDMEIAINTNLDGETKEPGRTAIEANMLFNIANKLPNGNITISTDTNDSSATIKGGKSKFQIPCKNADDFIGMPQFENGIQFSIPADDLKDLIVSVAFCSELNGNNAMMGGCKLQIKGNELSLCALDGHRIGIKKFTLNEYPEDTEAVIPTRTLLEISKILTGGDTVKAVVSKANVIFQFGETVVLSRLIAGEYFNFERIFKSEPTTIMHFSAGDFSDCVNRATVLIRESDKKPLILDISDDNVHFFAQSNVGTANEDLDIEKTGSDLRVGYNPRFLLDAINAIDHDNIEMRMCGARGPAIFTEDDDRYTYVVLPVNIS